MFDSNQNKDKLLRLKIGAGKVMKVSQDMPSTVLLPDLFCSTFISFFLLSGSLVFISVQNQCFWTFLDNTSVFIRWHWSPVTFLLPLTITMAFYEENRETTVVKRNEVNISLYPVTFVDVKLHQVILLLFPLLCYQLFIPLLSSVWAGLGGRYARDEEGRSSSHHHPAQFSLWIQRSPQPRPS